MKVSNKDYVLWWWQRDEFAEQREDFQATSSFDVSGSDLLSDAGAVADMQRAPLKEPPADYDVRAIMDSRFINGYDFNYSVAVVGNNGPSGVGWVATFVVPNGYRAIPRKWSINFDAIATGPAANSNASIYQGNAALPNNQNITIGMGTDSPIETFFLCEENTTFGIAGTNGNFPGLTDYTVNVNVYGTLLPVTEVALPLAASNPRKSV